MRISGWVAGVPLVILAAIFALSNRSMVTLDLWPLPFDLDLPLYLVVLGPLAIGLVGGASLAWAAAVPARRRARDTRRRAESLERQLGAVRGRTDGG
jgi:uncharacterized integral membrane protein